MTKVLSNYSVYAIFCFLGWATPFTYAQSPALQILNNSSRHQEWVEIKHGERTLHAFVVYPEVQDKAPAVIVIHENSGLTDWARSVADRVAEAGYIAIAPDLLSGMAPNGGKTTDFPSADAARAAISSLPPDQVTADLHAAADYVSKLEACNGKVSVAGFCWGGGQSFRFASNRPDLTAAFVFYGPPLEDPAEIAKINSPVYGFYGGNDARITATVPSTEERMKAAGKTYEAVVYEGAGHGFMRSGEEAAASEANRQAREEGWKRWQDLLKKVNAEQSGVNHSSHIQK